MKMTSVYRRRLKTARHFIFENIMDLDHVCHLHKKWFGNLRIIFWKSDYVEYRLDSYFYGLKQDILVRGAPVDRDRYWYEFIGPLARIRVDGVMEGPDGDLVLNETITYDFHWIWTPIFFLLRPIFRLQKQNILRDDSRLLEKEYELAQKGFTRVQDHSPVVVVYGGSGFFGRLVVEDLLRHSKAKIVIASRNPRPLRWGSFESRVRYVISDIEDRESVKRTLSGARVAVGCIGPFQGQSTNVLRACAETKVHYIDVADDRDFVARCHGLNSDIENSGIIALVGCSVVPGLSSLLTEFARRQLRSIDQVRIFISPGTRNPRGVGSFLCLLSTVGNEYPILDRGKKKMVKGWSGREEVHFPEPMGWRHVYFVVDIADYDLQPKYSGARTVEFKIGSELDFLNRGFEAVRWVKERFNLASVRPFVPLLRLLVGLAAPFGTTRGGVMVEVSGADHEKKTLSVLAEVRGERIPAILPSLAAQKIIRGELTGRGLVPLNRWLSEEDLRTELDRRGILYHQH